jgi:hypothetical protein
MQWLRSIIASFHESPRPTYLFIPSVDFQIVDNTNVNFRIAESEMLTSLNSLFLTCHDLINHMARWVIHLNWINNGKNCDLVVNILAFGNVD